MMAVMLSLKVLVISMMSGKVISTPDVSVPEMATSDVPTDAIHNVIDKNAYVIYNVPSVNTYRCYKSLLITRLLT